MAPAPDLPAIELPGAADRRRRRAVALTAVACAALVVVPLIPGALGPTGARALFGLPAESIAVLLLLVALARPSLRVAAAAVFAVVVVAGTVVALLDAAFVATVDRPFNLVEDGGALVAASGVVADVMGPVGAASVLAVVGVLVVLAVVAMTRAAVRVGGGLRDAGRDGRIALAVAASAWIVCAIVGAEVVPGVPVAASRAGEALVQTSALAVASQRAQAAFERELAADSSSAVPPGDLLTALESRDVIIVFVESYGRTAVEPADFTDGIARVLAEGESGLARTGYAAQSAFLTSPTFGGESWLAHATLQSGLWVDSQQKYARLLPEDRLTLTRAFRTAGWYTMAVVPSNTRPWEAGESFYGFDAVLDARNMGYRGPSFGYARMPDQFTWKAFHEHATAVDSAPVMAEIDLVSSHTPWTPLPRLVPWDDLGDGSVFEPQASQGEAAVVAWSDAERARELYADSVEYTLGAMFSYLETFESDAVLVVVGDHQPARIVSGPDAGNDVPVSIIAADAAVLEAIGSWGWEDGVHPSDAAPVWRMDEFRDRFLDAFSG